MTWSRKRRVSNQVVILDACVLYPAFLRDALMSLATAATPLYRARWTKDIHSEWVRNVLENVQGVTIEGLQRTRDQMNAVVPDCLVTGYESRIEKLSLPDMDDRHVLAAAIVGEASAIVTFNTKDFPESVVGDYDIQCVVPDDFICALLEESPSSVVDALHTMRAKFKKKPMAPDEFLASLLRQKLPNAVERLREFSSVL